MPIWPRLLAPKAKIDSVEASDSLDTSQAGR